MAGPGKDQWLTDELIRWLINDEGCIHELTGMDAENIKAWYKRGNAPDGFQEALSIYILQEIDWEEVADSLSDDDEEDEDDEEDKEEEEDDDDEDE